VCDNPLQNLLAGQSVLNDNNWHTIRFSRRASNLRLQVDGAPPVRGMLCMYQQHIYALLRVVPCRFFYQPTKPTNEPTNRQPTNSLRRVIGVSPPAISFHERCSTHHLQVQVQVGKSPPPPKLSRKVCEGASGQLKRKLKKKIQTKI